jgi:hypothetical protein
MRTAETEGDKHSTLHLEQEEGRFAKGRDEQRLRREMSAGMKPSHRTTRGRGGDS